MDPISIGLGTVVGAAIVALVKGKKKKASSPSLEGWSGTVFIPETGAYHLGMAERLNQELAKRGMNTTHKVRHDLLAKLKEDGDEAWSDGICSERLHLVVVGSVHPKEVKRTFDGKTQSFDEYTLNLRFYGPFGELIGRKFVQEIDFGGGSEEVARVLAQKVMSEIDDCFLKAMQNSLCGL